MRAAYQGDLHSLCWAMLPEAAQAEDALHDSLIRIRKALWTYDSQRGSLRVWLRAITRNVCRTERKRRARFVPLVTPTNNHSEGAEEYADEHAKEPQQIVSRAADIELIRTVVAGLREPHREPLRLRYMRGLSNSEAARDLGIPDATFRTRLSRAEAALKKELRRRGLDDPGLWLETNS